MEWERVDCKVPAYWVYGYSPHCAPGEMDRPYVMYTKDGWMVIPPCRGVDRDWREPCDTDLGPFPSDEAAKVAVRMLFPECFTEA